MTVVGETRVVPEPPAASVARLKPVFERARGESVGVCAAEYRADDAERTPAPSACDSSSLPSRAGSGRPSAISPQPRWRRGPRRSTRPIGSPTTWCPRRRPAGCWGSRYQAPRGAPDGDYVSYVLAVEEVAAASATLGAVLVVNNSLVAEVVHRFGTDGQKDAWLARLASGRAIGAFALSEAQAGTDAARQEDDRGGARRGRTCCAAARYGWPTAPPPTSR